MNRHGPVGTWNEGYEWKEPSIKRSMLLMEWKLLNKNETPKMKFNKRDFDLWWRAEETDSNKSINYFIFIAIRLHLSFAFLTFFQGIMKPPFLLFLVTWSWLSFLLITFIFDIIDKGISLSLSKLEVDHNFLMKVIFFDL